MGLPLALELGCEDVPKPEPEDPREPPATFDPPADKPPPDERPPDDFDPPATPPAHEEPEVPEVEDDGELELELKLRSPKFPAENGTPGTASESR